MSLARFESPRADFARRYAVIVWRSGGREYSRRIVAEHALDAIAEVPPKAHAIAVIASGYEPSGRVADGLEIWTWGSWTKERT